MAFPTTYTGWIAYVRDWLSADEYSDAQIASFLDLAQLRLNREMSSYGMEADVQLTLTADLPQLILPLVADFSKIRLVSVPDVGPLDVATISEIKKKIETDSSEDASNPSLYCIDAGKLYTYPLMQTGDVIDFFYYKKIPVLSQSVGTNVFSIDHPDALLYAALLEAAPYMQDQENITVWENKYTIALMTGSQVADRIKMGSTPLLRDFTV